MPKAHGKFSRLITNENLPPLENRVKANDPALPAVLEYLSYVSGSKGKVHCPFVKGIEESNGYFVRVFHKDDTRMYAVRAVITLRDSFAEIKNSAEFSVNGGGYKVSAIAAFSAPGVQGKQFHREMQAIDACFRLMFMEGGMMLGVMSPLHAPGGRNGGSEPLFVSKLPLLVARKMHKSDHVFMRNPEEKAAYEKFFGRAMD